MFRPSSHSYGDASLVSASDASPVPQQVSQPAADSSYVPSKDVVSALSAFLFGDPARQEAATVRQEIANLQAMVATAGPLRTYYLNRIAKLQAKLVVLEQEAAEAEYAANVSSVARTASAIALVVGVFAVGAGTIGLGTWAVLQATKISREREEIKQLRRA